MGSAEKLNACSHGFFAGIDQTVEIMRKDSPEEVEEVVREEAWVKQKREVELVKERERENREKYAQAVVGSDVDVQQQGDVQQFHNEAYVKSEEVSERRRAMD